MSADHTSETPSLDDFVPASLDTKTKLSVPLLTNIRFLPRDNLLSNIGEILSGMQRTAEPSSLRFPIATFFIAKDLVVSFNRNMASAPIAQCFISALHEYFGNYLDRDSGSLKSYTVDARSELTVWSSRLNEIIDETNALWRKLVTQQPFTDAEVATIPKLYGNKIRLIDLLRSVTAVSLPEGSTILDLMCGTGAVTRALSSKFRMIANDANDYAVQLTTAQKYTITQDEVAALIDLLRPIIDEAVSEISGLVRSQLDDEALFLHGDYDETSFAAYRAYCAQPVRAENRDGWPLNVYHLATATYSNAYFGLSQAVELDALRKAIDSKFVSAGRVRNICLTALLIAASICNSGPHFAQPRMITSLHSFADVVERRARSVIWEFELALARLATRPPTVYPVGRVMLGDWRVALETLVDRNTESRPTAVYVDPPYSKLQYSRYYHVLNTLLRYDYPTVRGVGRYPPKEVRFSSKFEYRPSTASREFFELIGACAARDLTLILSYSDKGFVPLSALNAALANHYKNIRMFSEQIRHHSQGRQLGTARGLVTEYVIVAKR